jgi:hypothetical protein
MRLVRIGLILASAFGVLGVDVEESLRTGRICDGSAYAKRHHRHHHKHARKRRHRHHHRAAPATEM